MLKHWKNAALFVLTLCVCFLSSTGVKALDAKKKAEIVHAHLNASQPVSDTSVTSKTIQVEGKFYTLQSNGTFALCKECNLAATSPATAVCETGTCNQSLSLSTKGACGSSGSFSVGSGPIRFGACSASSDGSVRGPVRTIVGFPFRVIRGIFGGCGG